MNFVIELFELNDNNAICTIINRLFKKRHYVSCKIIEKNTLVKVTIKIFFYYVFRTHDLSSSIIFDKKLQFVNAV